MFESIKIYVNEDLDAEKLSASLVEYGYAYAKRVAEEGDFSRLGDTITIYPLTFEYPLRIELSGSRVEKIRSVDPLTYEVVEDHNTAMILPIKGIVKKRIRADRASESGEESAIDNFVDIEAGDHVVHVEHGIGKYLGTEKIKIGKNFQDHLVLEYADGDKLYVPFSDLNKIQKYVGAEKRPPKIYKLGSKLWRRVKEGVKSGVNKVALELLEVQVK
ncbi:MAG: CarD family transcriptional regulator, partial [Candidatus Omnitrophota bacterium]